MRGALMAERERLFGVLQEFDFLEPYPSQANFILSRARFVSVWHVLRSLAAGALRWQCGQ